MSLFQLCGIRNDLKLDTAGQFDDEGAACCVYNHSDYRRTELLFVIIVMLSLGHK